MAISIKAVQGDYLGISGPAYTISDSADIVLENPCPSTILVSISTTNKRIILPKMDDSNSLRLGQSISITNVGVNSFDIYDHDVTEIFQNVPPLATIILSLEESSSAGTWAFDPILNGERLITVDVTSPYEIQPDEDCGKTFLLTTNMSSLTLVERSNYSPNFYFWAVTNGGTVNNVTPFSGDFIDGESFITLNNYSAIRVINGTTQWLIASEVQGGFAPGTGILSPKFGGTGVDNGVHTLTVSEDSTINQDVSTAGEPKFAKLNVNADSLTLNAISYDASIVADSTATNTLALSKYTGGSSATCDIDFYMSKGTESSPVAVDTVATHFQNFWGYDGVQFSKMAYWNYTVDSSPSSGVIPTNVFLYNYQSWQSNYDNIQSWRTDGTVQIKGSLQLPAVYTSGSYAATIRDYYIGIDTGFLASTVSFPADPKDNQILIISDYKSNANNINITLNGNGKTINGPTVINTNAGSLLYIYNSDNWYPFSIAPTTPSTPLCQVYRATDQGDSSEFIMSWTDASIDTHGFFDGMDPTKITIPSGLSGKYKISYWFSLLPDVTLPSGVSVLIQTGSAVESGGFTMVAGPSRTTPFYMSTCVTAQAGDYFTLNIGPQSGTLTVGALHFYQSNGLTVEYLGP